MKTLLTRFCLILILLVLVTGSQAAAFTQNDADCSGQTTCWWNPDFVGAGACSTATDTTTSVAVKGQNVKTAYDFFLGNGFSKQQSAGIVGNLMYESDGTSGGIDPTKGEAGGGGGYGSAQFTGGTLTAMRTWVTAKGEDPASLQGQLDFILYQLNGGEAAASTAIKAASTVADATSAFGAGYERPKDLSASISDRVKDAQAAYDKYSSDAASAPSSSDAESSASGCAAANSGSPDCATASGTAKILCEAKKYNGIYYLFGGGHAGYAAFRSACPLSALPDAAATSTVAKVGPCATDCSGLVSIAVDQAFGQSFNWSVSNDNGMMVGGGADNWKSVSISQAQPGDIVTRHDGGDGHVEIVDHIQAGTVYTFGSHQTGKKTSGISTPASYWSAAYHWSGPGGG